MTRDFATAWYELTHAARHATIANERMKFLGADVFHGDECVKLVIKAADALGLVLVEKATPSPLKTLDDMLAEDSLNAGGR